MTIILSQVLNNIYIKFQNLLIGMFTQFFNFQINIFEK